MKNLLLMILLIVMQQSLVFTQIDKRLSQKNVHHQDSKSHFSRRIQLDRLKSIKKMNTFSMANTTILSLPDTIIEYSINDTTRSIHTYDKDGNFLSWTSQTYLNNTWKNSERESYTYDANGNYITYSYEEWGNDSWLNDYRESYTYDANGNFLTSLSEEWIDNTWVASQYRYTNEYDAFNNLLSETEEKYMDGEWVNRHKYSYTYDSNGNLLTFLEYAYGSNPWEYNEKATYTYDLSGNIQTELNQYYSANTWSNGNLETYTYNIDGSVDKKFYQNLDYNNEPFTTEYDTVTYEYDSNGNLLSKGEWEEYTYDSNGNLLTWDFFTWNTESKQWEKKWSEPCLIFIKTTYSGQIWNYPVQKFGNGILFFTYGSANKMIFHWTPVSIMETNSINEYNSITIFPNPTINALNINGIENLSIAKVFSMDGKQMITRPITGSNQILNVSQLKSGIYILKIETPDGIVMKKFIKQ